MARWALVNFDECVERWVSQSSPPTRAVKSVLAWFLDVLSADPFQPGARRMVDAFGTDLIDDATDECYPDFTAAQWYLILPITTTGGRKVLCAYEIHAQERAITCLILEETTTPFVG